MTLSGDERKWSETGQPYTWDLDSSDQSVVGNGGSMCVLHFTNIISPHPTFTLTPKQKLSLKCKLTNTPWIITGWQQNWPYSCYKHNSNVTMNIQRLQQNRGCFYEWTSWLWYTGSSVYRPYAKNTGMCRKESQIVLHLIWAFLSHIWYRQCKKWTLHEQFIYQYHHLHNFVISKCAS